MILTSRRQDFQYAYIAKDGRLMIKTAVGGYPPELQLPEEKEPEAKQIPIQKSRPPPLGTRMLRPAQRKRKIHGL